MPKRFFPDKPHPFTRLSRKSPTCSLCGNTKGHPLHPVEEEPTPEDSKEPPPTLSAR